jgi:hypothetical protein
MRSSCIVAACVILALLTVGCSQQDLRSDIRDGRVNRDKRSLSGIDSMHVYASVSIMGQDREALSGTLQNHLAGRFDSAGLELTRSPFVFNAGYASVWIDGYPAIDDDTDSHLFFSALMQVERYAQIRRTKTIADETERLALATTWKKFGVGSCPSDSLEFFARRLMDHWIDTLLMELPR